MIQDGFDYGDGYEKATEPGPYLEFWTGEKWTYRHDQQEPLSSCYKYRKPIKPKDEKMEEQFIMATAHEVYSGNMAKISLVEAERLGDIAKRIKAEIAKREEIGPGDYAFHKDSGTIFKCYSVENGWILDKTRTCRSQDRLKKLHPTPEVRSWLDKTIGGDG